MKTLLGILLMAAGAHAQGGGISGEGAPKIEEPAPQAAPHRPPPDGAAERQVPPRLPAVYPRQRTSSILRYTLSRPRMPPLLRCPTA
jgi:hypothetical protein